MIHFFRIDQMILCLYMFLCPMVAGKTKLYGLLAGAGRAVELLNNEKLIAPPAWLVSNAL